MEMRLDKEDNHLRLLGSSSMRSAMTPSPPSSPTSTTDIENSSIDSDMEIPHHSSFTSLCGLVASTEERRRKRVTLNVGGEKHEILWDTLDRFPQTRLGKLKECRDNRKALLDICDDYCLEENEYFFDRHPKAFGAILNLYRNRRLHFQGDFCAMDFNQDLIYWGIDENYLDSCCRIKFQKKREYILDKIRKQPNLEDPTELFTQYKDEDFGTGKCAKWRKFVWDVFERPFYRPAQVMSMLSVICILLSIVTFCLSTVSDFQEYDCMNPNKTLCSLVNFETVGLLEVNSSISQSDFVLKDSWKITVLERTCIIWFTVEYLLRLFACPNKCSFVKHPLNIIDLLAILPYYCSQFLMLFNTSYSFVQALFIFRVLRILKLSRHSTGLQSLGYTFQRSRQDLGVLLLFLGVGVVIFSSLAYFAERGSNSNFESIPGTFWWTLITMTTVGYGDIVPVTILGKIVAGVTSIAGVVIVALPIAFTMNSFGEFYEKQRQKEKMLRLHKHFFRKDREAKVNA